MPSGNFPPWTVTMESELICLGEINDADFFASFHDPKLPSFKKVVMRRLKNYFKGNPFIMHAMNSQTLFRSIVAYLTS